MKVTKKQLHEMIKEAITEAEIESDPVGAGPTVDVSEETSEVIQHLDMAIAIMKPLVKKYGTGVYTKNKNLRRKLEKRLEAIESLGYDFAGPF